MNPYKFKTTPYSHQVDALRKIIPLPRGGGLFMDMGTGKTKVAIDYANILEQLGEIDQVLVIGPLSTLGVWDAEIRKHSSSDTLAWRVINYDKTVREQYFKQLVNWINGRTLLVCDESHRIKNATAKRTRAATVLGKLCARVLLLTGTPVSKHPLDLFAQMRAVDEGILGSSWGVFKRTYAVWGGYGGYQLIKYMNLGQLKKRVDPYIFQVKKEDCLDLPSKTHQIIPVTLSESRGLYDRLARESIAYFEGLEVETPIVLTRLLRLSQLTGGWFKSNEEKRRAGDEKLTAFRLLLEEMYDEERLKVVVFCRFIDELKDISHVADEIGYRVIPFHGKTPASQRERFIASFHESTKPTVFVAQIATGSLGISLTAASEAIFYSHTYDYAEFQQACDRLHRLGQRHPVTYYHLLARDTVDEAVWLSLRTKRRIAELVLREPELIT